MGDGAAETQWCPQCGAEYRAGYERCPDCDVALADEPPPPSPRRRTDGRDHDDSAYDLSDWDAGRRRWLELMCEGAAIAYGWDDGVLRVADVHQDAVDEMVDSIEGEELDGEDAPAPPPDEVAAWRPPGAPGGTSPAGPVVAGSGRRLWGYVVDAFVLEVLLGVYLLAERPHHGHPTFAWTWPLTVAATGYVVVPTAVWGRTLGKLVAGTRVVLDGDGRVPGWWRSLVRWAVPEAPVLVLGAFAAVPVLRFTSIVVWPVVVYGPVLGRPWHRGLHDRAAGTVVVVVEREPAIRPPITAATSAGAGRGT